VTVSVIVPTHNYGQYIRQTVESVRRQTWTDWECLVVDDGSADGTGNIMAELAATDPRIRYLRQENRGPSAARNAGLAATSGEFVQFLDADDLIGPCKLEHQLHLFSEHPGVDIVYGDARYFRDGEMPTSTIPGPDRWIEMPPLGGVSGAAELVLPALLRDNIMVVQAPLIRRSVLSRVGGFAIGLRRWEDWDLWLRCALAGSAFLWDDCDDPDALSYVRVHESSNSQDRVAMAKAALHVRQQVQRHLCHEKLRRLNQVGVHQQWASLGILEGLGEHPASGVRYLVRAGLAERRLKWLAWGLLIPFLRQPPGSLALRTWRRVKARRTATGWHRGAKSGQQGGNR